MTKSKIAAIATVSLLMFTPVTGIAGDFVTSQKTVPYPPLVTDIQQSNQNTIQHATSARGAAAGAGGFPARPDGAVGIGASVLTSISVLAIIGLAVSAGLPESSSTSDGSASNSSTVSTQ